MLATDAIVMLCNLRDSVEKVALAQHQVPASKQTVLVRLRRWITDNLPNLLSRVVEGMNVYLVIFGHREKLINIRSPPVNGGCERKKRVQNLFGEI